MLVNRDRAIAWLSENVPPSRLQHILGVEQTAKALAHHHGLNEAKAQTAGLLHDLAKYYKPTRLLEIASETGLAIDAICQANPHLLHADVSAIVAQTEFGIQDEEILAAIREHTLGNPQMSPLSCVVFIADTIEPNRGNSKDLEAIREISWQNLYQAVQQACDYSLTWLIKTRRVIHPRTVETRNWALAQVKPSSTVPVLQKC